MGDFKVRCVKVFGHPETQKLLDEAFQCLKEQMLSPEWFSEDDCFTITQRKKNEVYIFDVFEGEAFKHIADLQCRLLGPLSVITSLACKKDIPRRLTPVYNLAMKDIVVCCTNIDREQRDPIHEKVEWMGGQAYKVFTEDVTHVVAGSVGSKKYQVAGSYGKKIMLPTWVDKVWEKSKLEAVHGDDEQFQTFKCPIFYGHVITVSGLNAADRQEAKRLIEKEGGVYTGEMKARECTHLIINEARGQKYLFAKKWEIHVVRSEWLYESIEKGFCQDEADYPVQGEPSEEKMKTSTPERRSMAGNCGEIGEGDLSNISMIPMAQVNETGFTTMSNMTAQLEDLTEHLDVTKAPAEMFLDGCKIYLSGFRGAALEKLRKIINMGGGSRFNQITDNLTHVVIGERINSDIDIIKSLSIKPYSVTSQWLVESYKQEKHVDENPYLSTDVPQHTTNTPHVKKDKKKPRAAADSVKPGMSDEPKGENKEDDVQDIISQYLSTEQNQPSDRTRSNDTTVAPEAEDLTQDPSTCPGNVEEGIFAGRSFIFLGYSEENVSVLYTYVRENGGQVIQGTSRKVPDYAVVPVDGFPVDRTVTHIVSEVWLLMCVEAAQLLDINVNPLFVPIEVHNETQPLSDCVLSFSGYAGTERDTLVDIAEVLGAKTQEYFVRAATKKGLLPSTHLVVNAPEGSKYQAAKKWGIPAVSKLWVLACAKSGRKEVEEIYLIDNVVDDNTQTIQNQSTAEIAKPQELNQSRMGTEAAHTASTSGKTTVISEETSEVKHGELCGDPNISVKKQNTSVDISNAANMADFSTMGDTEAILAGLNTQGDQNTMQDNDRSAHLSPADTAVENEGDFDPKKAGDGPEHKNKMQSDLHSNLDTDNSVHKESGSRSESKVTRDLIADSKEDVHLTEDQSGEDVEVIIVNKHLKHVQPQSQREQKKVETPPLTRFMKSLEKNPPKIGTPGLAKQSLWEKMREKNMGQSYKLPEQDLSMDTPPYTKYVQKVFAAPANLGTPQLSDMSARERLMGKKYVGPRTVEVRRRREQMRQSQKENVETPLQGRVKELKGHEGDAHDKDTPSKFLDPEVRYIPKFNVEELLKDLDSPEDQRRLKSRKHNDTLDDDELFELAMKKASKRIDEAATARLQGNMPSSSQAMLDEIDGDYEEQSTALNGVVITVAKKLAKDQEELNNIVASLGGDYRWSYDSSCTHFIFQGRQNDIAKDFKHAKSKGLKIVSPHWVYMCQEQNARVEESLFPHTFNPNLSLSVVSTKRTPLRTPRSSRRTARAAGKGEPIAQPVSVDDDVPQPSTSGVQGPKCTASTPVAVVKSSNSPESRVSTPKLSLRKTLKSPLRTSSDEGDKPVPMETGGSLEMREVLSKQLEDVMSKTKKRRRSKRLNCSGNISTPEELPNSSSRTSRRTQENQRSSGATRETADGQVEQKSSVEAAPSQPFHVSWDDPMSRLEHAKLAHKLERANSPTQEVAGMYDMDPEDAQYSESEDEAVPVPPFTEQQKVKEETTPKQSTPVANKTPTPEGPSIAFPTSNKSRKVTPPRPVQVEEADDIVPKPPHVFIMSGLSGAERDDYGALVEQLGGKVLDSQSFDQSCTHLVINNMTRNEKFLASIASGKWVLHKSYFEACRQENRFVQEDLYEWGSEGTLSLVKNMESNVRLLAIAARDWRLKIQEEKVKSPEHYGAFCSWHVVLCCDKGREQNYRRLLTAGGATVLNVKPPYKGPIEATHALMDLHKVKVEQCDLEILLNSGCLCLKPEYISGYLCNPDVDIQDYEPPEVTALRTVMSECSENTGKRKKSSSGNTSQKRSKRR